MERTQIADRLKELLKDNQFMSLRNYVDLINEESSLINDLALDSIQILELVVKIENEFSFTCEPTELNVDMFNRFGDLITFVQNKLQNKCC